jgi:protoheme IX farnesyltransferase
MSGDTKSSPGGWRDYVALAKPGIVRMCLITTAGGLGLAGAEASISVWFSALVGSALAVASANAFNMIWERESDRKMMRTRNRPIASGRMSAATACAFAGVVGAAGLLILWAGTNALTAVLALFALVSYVLVYTPLKFHTPLALVIGAVPGAVPPLLGWTAATNSLEIPGLILFGILLAWQMPHFLAIALFQKEDYARAGIKVVPLVRGDRVAKIQAIAWAAILLPVSLMLTPLGVTGAIYFAVAAVLGLGFLVWAITGLWNEANPKWARGFFFASLVYLPVLTLAIVLDVALLS